MDTDLIIDFLNNRPEAIQLLERLERQREQLGLTDINRAELLRGAATAKSSQHRETLQALMSRLERVPLDLESVEVFGEVMAKLDQAGKALDPMDGLIASMALRHRARIATRNRQHFERIPGLKLVDA